MSFKKIIIALAMTNAILISAVSAVSANETNLLVLGDSIASGYGLQNNEKRYSDIVANTLELSLSNYAVPGYTTSDLLNQLRNDSKVTDQVKKSDIIEISIGGNDLLELFKGDFSAGMSVVSRVQSGDYSEIDRILDKAAENFRKIIVKIRSVNTDAVIIVQNLYTVRFTIGSVTEEVTCRMNSRVFDDYLKEHKGAFTICNVKSAMADNAEYFAADMIHPSESGHAVIAASLLITVRETTGLGKDLPTGNASEVLSAAESVTSDVSMPERQEQTASISQKTESSMSDGTADDGKAADNNTDKKDRKKGLITATAISAATASAALIGYLIMRKKNN